MVVTTHCQAGGTNGFWKDSMVCFQGYPLGCAADTHLCSGSVTKPHPEYERAGHGQLLYYDCDRGARGKKCVNFLPLDSCSGYFHFDV